MVALVNAYGFGYIQNNNACIPLGFSDFGGTLFVLYFSGTTIVAEVYYGKVATTLNNATVYVDYIKSL